MEQHITDTPKKFIKDKLNLEVNGDSEIQISNELIHNYKEKFQINVTSPCR